MLSLWLTTQLKSFNCNGISTLSNQFSKHEKHNTFQMFTFEWFELDEIHRVQTERANWNRLNINQSPQKKRTAYPFLLLIFFISIASTKGSFAFIVMCNMYSYANLYAIINYQTQACLVAYRHLLHHQIFQRILWVYSIEWSLGSRKSVYPFKCFGHICSCLW